MATPNSLMPNMGNLVNPNFDEQQDYNDLSELPHAACYNCNNRRIARFYDRYKRMVANGVKPNEALDRLGFDRYCCRQLMMNPIKLPLGVNAEVDYQKLGLSLNPDKISFRTGSSNGFLITEPRQQKRQGLAQGIGPSVPVVNTKQPLPPLMSRPITTFGTQPSLPTVGQYNVPQVPTVGQSMGNMILPLLPTNPGTFGTQPNSQNITSTLQMFGTPIIAPQGTANRGLNMVTQGLGGLTLQPQATVNDPSNGFPVLEAFPSVERQTTGASSQYGFRS